MSAFENQATYYLFFKLGNDKPAVGNDALSSLSFMSCSYYFIFSSRTPKKPTVPPEIRKRMVTAD